MKTYRLIFFLVIFLFTSNIHGQERDNQYDSDYNFEELFNHLFNLHLEKKQTDSLDKIFYDSISPKSYFFLQLEENTKKDSIKTYFHFKKLYFDLGNNENYGHGNSCSIFIDTRDSVFVRGEYYDNMEKFKQFIYNFLSNPCDDEYFPEKEPKNIEYFGEVMVPKSIVFLNVQMVSDSLNHRTSTKKLFNKIIQIITINQKLRNELAIVKWGLPYNELKFRKKLAINQAYPLRMRVILNYEIPLPPPPPFKMKEDD
jgi:hypothetical protein